MPPEGLIYYPDSRPGIRRRRCGRGFSYLAPDGTRIDNGKERKRIQALAVPPAYEDVWICPLAHGHLQATGRDVRARKQYRYHPEWTEYRAQQKYSDLADFGRALPGLRRKISEGLRSDAGDEELALATVLAMIDRLSLRVGNEAYAAENGTFGATTLRARHVSLEGSYIRLKYKAKGGQTVNKRLHHRGLQKALEKIHDLPGAHLLNWEDEEGRLRQVTSDQVNEFLAEYAGEGITAKSFRTWNGSLAAFKAARKIVENGEVPTVKALAEAAAEELHNTPTLARNSYIHPAVINLTEDEGAERLEAAVERAVELSGLRAAEGALIRLIED
jgi:DNA topoisomerase-1